MTQSLSAVYLHLIFSTKERRPVFQDADLRARLHAYIAVASGQIDCPALKVGGVEDHVHVLARHGREIPQAEWVKEIKRVSSRWLKSRGPTFADFQRQAGYAVRMPPG